LENPAFPPQFPYSIACPAFHFLYFAQKFCNHLIRFILNQTEIETALPPGTLLLDFIRYNQHLTGTKIGCREGDCGACTILLGSLKNGQIQYKSVTSCLTALGNVNGMHVVTIEGLNDAHLLSPVQQAMAEASASQCGFCTPGFIVSLTGFAMCAPAKDQDTALAAISGNICRCTGYKSIERAAASICQRLQSKPNQNRSIQFALKEGWIPNYFETIPQKLQDWIGKNYGSQKMSTGTFLGGGTDLYVQQPEAMQEAEIQFLAGDSAKRNIWVEGGFCHMDAGCTVTDLLESPVILQTIPGMVEIGKLVSSEPIRNIATIAGNFVNASPIGDFSILFLALNAQVLLSDGQTTRTLPLRQFFKGYKILEKASDEFVIRISFPVSKGPVFLHFEKVCKRTWLDIASVNMALFAEMEGDRIKTAGISAGGVGPVPLYLSQASDFLQGKKPDASILSELLAIVQQEISPISDVRGTASYKRLLLNQLIKAGFSEQFQIPLTHADMHVKA
jgi:xanthine dehydrogenase small subunit